MKNKEDKDSLIAQAAMQEFSKFGLRKTTMQDVAKAADISRQTLYNRVPNKDELLRLVANHYFSDNIQRCQAALAHTGQLEDALDILVEHFVIEPWRTIRAMPEAEEFELASTGIIAEQVKLAVQQKASIIRDVMLRTVSAPAMSEQLAENLAQLFCATAAGIKSAADSEADLLSLCETMKVTLIKTVAGRAAAA